MNETSPNHVPSPEDVNARIEGLFADFQRFPNAVAHLNPKHIVDEWGDTDEYWLKNDNDDNEHSFFSNDRLAIVHRNQDFDDPENNMLILYSIPGRRYNLGPGRYRNTTFKTLIERKPSGMEMITSETGYGTGLGEVEFNSWINDPEDIDRLQSFIDNAPSRLVLGNPDILKEILERTRKSSHRLRLSRLRAPLRGLVDFSKPKHKNDLKVVEFNYDDYPEVMPEDKLPAGPGLKKYEIDTFQTNDFGRMICSPGGMFEGTMDKVLKTYKAANPNLKEPVDSPDKVYATAIMSGSRVAPELQDWIHKHRLQNAYFTPEMVVESLVTNEDVRVETTQHDNLLVWKFITNDGETIEMSRTADGSEMSEHNYIKEPTVNPYLAVRYEPEYDHTTQEIVCSPRIGDSFGKIGGEIGEIIKSALGVTEQRIHQPVEFTVVGAGPKMFYKPYEGNQIEPTYANVEAYVVADFPKSAATSTT